MVLRIHDILVWIRIRICGSMPLTNGSGFRSCYFRHWLSRLHRKTNLKRVFLLITIWRYITSTSFFKNKKSKRSHKAVGIPVFLTIIAWWSGSIRQTIGSGSRRPKNIRIRRTRIRIRNTETNLWKQMLRHVGIYNIKSWPESSELALLSATTTAWVLLFSPTVAEPCFTASIAYSTYNTVINSSLLF